MIRGEIKRLLSKASGLFRHARTLHRPSREEIALLPPFDALRLDKIIEVYTADAAERAFAALTHEPVVGFDTESQPTFIKGQLSSGPHVVQFAAPSRTYVFILHDAACRRAARDLIASAKLKKVGFGLEQERRLIPIRLGVRPESMVDLEALLREHGYIRGTGVKTAVALVLGRQFSKSRRASTSNWKRHRLSPQQLVYAANDAYAALCVYQKLYS